MTTAYLALGSNLNDPQIQIQKAIDHIRCIKQSRLNGISHLYESKPLDNSVQNDYINAAVCLETTLLPDELLYECQLIERKLGKIKLYHWGPRSIDIDIVLYGHYDIDEKGLTIPHPGITKRDFVLKPLLDINPRLTLPCGTPLNEFLTSCQDNQIKRIEFADKDAETS